MIISIPIIFLFLSVLIIITFIIYYYQSSFKEYEIHKSKWILLYFFTIIIFAMIYNCFPFFNSEISFLDSVYFSAVTITTLGYGDVFPKTTILKFITAFEAIIGLLILGLFLNEQAEKGVERKERIYFNKRFYEAIFFVETIESYVLAAKGSKNVIGNPLIMGYYVDKYIELSKDLKKKPCEYKFNEHIKDNIFYFSSIVVDLYDKLSDLSKCLDSEIIFSLFNGVVAELRNISEAPIIEENPYSGAQSVQHKLHRLFLNTSYICSLVPNMELKQYKKIKEENKKFFKEFEV